MMIEATKIFYNENLVNIGTRVTNNNVENSFGFKKNQLLQKAKNLMPSTILKSFYMDIKAKFQEYYEKIYAEDFNQSKALNPKFVEQFRKEKSR
jgi:hypothetical protein